MIFRKHFLSGIRDGSITVAFRRWTKPSVRSGGTLLTPIGQLQIVSVKPVDPAKITARDAKRAGFIKRDELLAELSGRADGIVFRIDLGELRPDPRIALREALPAGPDEINDLVRRLDRLDQSSPTGAWTRAVLELIAKHPARRAGDLCEMFGQEKAPFKVNVRKLKRLGLTESLEVGYRLSPRGVVVLDAVRGTRGKRRKP